MTEPKAAAPLPKELRMAWKRATKLLKLKDTGKKIEGLAYCGTDGRFFREGGCVAVLMAFLTRTKQHEVLHQTLLMFVKLLASGDPALSCAENVLYVLEEGRKPASPWNSGEYFLNTLSMPLSDDSKMAAIKIYTSMVECCAAAVASDLLPSLLTLGRPIEQLASALHSPSPELQYLALNGLFVFLKHTTASDEAIATLFSIDDGPKGILSFLHHTETRFALLALQLLEWLTQSDVGRDRLNADGLVTHLTEKLQSWTSALLGTVEAEIVDATCQCLSLVVLVLARVHIVSNFAIAENATMVTDAVQAMAAVLSTSTLQASANMATALSVLASIGRLVERHGPSLAAATQTGLLTTLLYFLVVDERNPREASGSSEGTDAHDVDPKTKAKPKPGGKEKPTKDAPPPPVEEVDPALLEAQAKAKAEKAAKTKVLYATVRNAADKLLHLCTGDGPLFLEENVLMQYDAFQAIFAIPDTATQLRAARLAAKVVQHKENGAKFGLLGTPCLLTVLQDQFKLQSTPLATDALAELPTDDDRRSVEAKYSSFVMYISMALAPLSIHSTEACDACGDETKSPVGPLVSYIVHHAADGDILLENPLSFPWGLDDRSISPLEHPPVRAKPQVWAAQAVAALARCYAHWVALATPRPDEPPPPVEKKGAKDKKPVVVKEIPVTGDRVTQRIATHAFALLQFLREITDFDVHTEVLAILRPLPLLPNGRKSLLKQALDAPLEPIPDGVQLGHWPFLDPLAPAMAAHARVLEAILHVFHRDDSPLDNIAAALALLHSLLLDEKSAPDEYDMDLFVNAGLHLGVLPMLIALLDTQRIDATPIDGLQGALRGLAQYLIQLGKVREPSVQAKLKVYLDEEEDGSQPQLDAVARTKTITTRYADLLSRPFDFGRFGYMAKAAIHMAIDLNEAPLVQLLLDAGVSAQLADRDGSSCLMQAFVAGNDMMVRALLDAGADVNAVNAAGTPVLKFSLFSSSVVQDPAVQALIAARHHKTGDPFETAKALDSLYVETISDYTTQCLERGSDPNVTSELGTYPLHWILSTCHLHANIRGCDLCFRLDSRKHPEDVIEQWISALLNAGSDMNACNKLGRTPLHLALLHGHSGPAKLLLERGANPFVRDRFGCFSLHYLCLGRCGEASVQLLDMILGRATKFDVTTGVHNDLRKGKSDAAKRLVELDAIFAAGLENILRPHSLSMCPSTPAELLLHASQSGYLPLHFACGATEPDIDASYEHLRDSQPTRRQILEHLVFAYDADLAAPTATHANALHIACKADVEGANAEIINLLLQSDVGLNHVHDVSPIDRRTDTLPVGASALFNSSVAYVSSANVALGTYHVLTLPCGDLVPDVPETALRSISSRASLLLDGDFAYAPLHYAVQHSDNATWQLLHAGAELTPEGADVPLLALAVAAGRSADVVAYLTPLLSGQIPTRVELNTEWRGSALHFAARRGSADVLGPLLATPNAGRHVKVKHDGFTPLHMACLAPAIAPNVILQLLDAGASLWEVEPVLDMAPVHRLLVAHALPLLSICIERGHLARSDLRSVEAYVAVHLADDDPTWLVEFADWIVQAKRPSCVQQANDDDDMGDNDAEAFKAATLLQGDPCSPEFVIT
ncbi:hypothetical protein SDRG_00851 [Saprolegnia diclina VS20]|uniref:Uncharacterized protein n=1 Tax=Saprolegnia diclina (strain VS20) TaxID=1156394 RepID=T0QUY4_SAPDV|nr:hypothetical protein SDRG_00851 [Saprolegnia diclina VS20]EQC42004.1 hypothetical protein SDRG_00851 [Saprolegnia diclina VS20]|eukprot:XP_008604573.1 hypothetical protein SDRG_00851 [Saprolegnia diclina VS20]